LEGRVRPGARRPKIVRADDGELIDLGRKREIGAGAKKKESIVAG